MASQVVARYFPKKADGTPQAHKFITGDSREELVRKAEQANPNPAKLYLACIWATPEQGPNIWDPSVGWYPAADTYVPR